MRTYFIFAGGEALSRPNKFRKLEHIKIDTTSESGLQQSGTKDLEYSEIRLHKILEI